MKNKFKRIFLIVLDSFGIGELPDANDYNDKGSNTLKTISKSNHFDINTMNKIGLFNIDGVDCCKSLDNCIGSYARMTECSKGKDTTTGHWEMMGIISKTAMPTYPNGFPNEIINEFERQTGKKVICNKPYSGTKVIQDYGDEHIKTGALIVYTSADSVFQIAAHEDVVPLDELYKYCEIARKILCGRNAVGRVIARPFSGESGKYYRTANRHDFALNPPRKTVLDNLKDNGYDVISIGKIADIFNDQGITDKILSKNNREGMGAINLFLNYDFNGLCFANLVDFDMLYGHRNDIDGYATAITEFDMWLSNFLKKLNDDDLLLITGDHGCDPGTPSTDHSREYTPLLIYSPSLIDVGQNYGTRTTFADIGKTIEKNFGINSNLPGVAINI